MKKKKAFSNVLEWLKDAGLKVFAVLALLAGGFYVIAADITWPASQPNATSGVVGTFVGESSDTYNKTVAGAITVTVTGYDQANALCSGGAGDVANSHVCTPDEMANSYNHGTVGVSPIFTYNTSKMLWINSGPPGYTANSNDCNGWKSINAGTDPESTNYGAVWNFSTRAGGLTPCKADKKFACCK